MAIVVLPIVWLTLSVLFLSAPWPAVALERSSRIVRDGDRVDVPIPLPFRGTAFLWVDITQYLQVTLAPHSIAASFMSSRIWLRDLPPYILRVFPQIASYPGVGGGGTRVDPPNVEQLLRLRPSAIFLWSFLAPELRGFGLPAIGMPTPLEVAGDWNAWVARTFAQTVGTDKRFDALVALQRANLAALARDLGPSRAGPRPRVLLFGALSRDGDYSMAIGRRYPAGRAIDLAGGIDLVEANAQLDIERIVALDPSVIILPATFGWITPAQFMADPRFALLTCVRDRRVYQEPRINGDVAEGIVAFPLYARWLAEVFHPRTMPATMRRTLADVDAIVYRTRPTSGELDADLEVAANRGARDARRFEAP